MLYFTLPNFYQNFHVERFWISLFRQTKYKFFKDGDKISFSESTGNFPYCYWNGGFNNNKGPGAFYSNITDFCNSFDIPVRLNCSNINLTNDDFVDNYAHLILSTFDNGCHSVEISNLELLEYIYDKFPNYKYIFSKEAYLLNAPSVEIINNLIDCDKFRLIQIPDEYRINTEFLSQIKNRSKLEVTLNPLCDINCKDYVKCKMHSHLSQYEYSGINVYEHCDKCKNYQFMLKDFTSFEDLKSFYSKLGINHFNLSETVNGIGLLNFLVDFFTYPQYKEEILKCWNEYLFNSGAKNI